MHTLRSLSLTLLPLIPSGPVCLGYAFGLLSSHHVLDVQQHESDGLVVVLDTHIIPNVF